MSEGLAQPLSILLVEPNADVRESFAAMLSCIGYALDVATCGGEALAAAGRNPPDVVLLEPSLKDMSGTDLCLALRRGAGMKKLSVIAITSYCTDQQREDMAGAGFDRVLLKPVSLREIMEVLRPIDRTGAGAAFLAGSLAG